MDESRKKIHTVFESETIGACTALSVTDRLCRAAANVTGRDKTFHKLSIKTNNTTKKRHTLSDSFLVDILSSFAMVMTGQDEN